MFKRFKPAVYVFLSGITLLLLGLLFKMVIGWLILGIIFSILAFIPIIISILLAIVIFINKFI